VRGVVEWSGCGFWLKTDDGPYMPNEEYRRIVGHVYEPVPT
jgi:hypothetical protein